MKTIGVSPVEFARSISSAVVRAAELIITKPPGHFPGSGEPSMTATLDAAARVGCHPGDRSATTPPDSEYARKGQSLQTDWIDDPDTTMASIDQATCTDAGHRFSDYLPRGADPLLDLLPSDPSLELPRTVLDSPFAI